MGKKRRAEILAEVERILNPITDPSSPPLAPTTLPDAGVFPPRRRGRSATIPESKIAKPSGAAVSVSANPQPRKRGRPTSSTASEPIPDNGIRDLVVYVPPIDASPLTQAEQQPRKKRARKAKSAQPVSARAPKKGKKKGRSEEGTSTKAAAQAPSRRSKRRKVETAEYDETDAEEFEGESAEPESPHEDEVGKIPVFLSRAEYEIRAGKNSFRSLVNARIFDWAKLEKLGVNARIQALFANIGWEHFLSIIHPVYVDLVLEFISSFQFFPQFELHDSNAILFTLKGKEFRLSVNSLNVLLGFESKESLFNDEYVNVVCGLPKDLSSTIHDRWQNMSIESVHEKGHAKSASIVDDGLRLCHRFLAHNFFGRIDSMNVVTQQEICILGNMLQGVKMNFGYWIATRWKFTSTHFHGKIPLGAFVTLLVEKLGVDVPELNPIPSSTFSALDFLNMRLVYVNNDGDYQLLKPGMKGPSYSSFAGPSGASSSADPATESTPQWASQLPTAITALGEHIKSLDEAIRRFNPPSDP